MATIPTFNSTVIARVAAGLYDLQLGNETMDWALEQVNFGTSVEELAQSVYDADFSGMDYEEVAALLVANLGISARNSVSTAVIDIANTIVEDALTAGGAGAEGATIVSLVNLFSTLTTHPDVGLSNAAKAFNTQIVAAVNYAEVGDTVTVPVHPPEEALNFLITPMDAAGLDAMRLTGDTDVRIDFTNENQQITGLDVDGDGLIEFNGSERTPAWLEDNIETIGDNHSGFEIIDAYSRNPLDHTDTANNFTGDIYFDGSSFSGGEADGTKTDGNIFLGGLGNDTALGGVGNDFFAAGGVAQGMLDDGDAMYGGRNADFFFGEFSMLDIVDGNGQFELYVDGGNTSDDEPAGVRQSDQDSDWFLPEASDDDEPVGIELNEGESGDDFDVDVSTRTGQVMDLDDVENIDASGNLYGFLDDMEDGAGNQLRVGGRSYDSRYDDGANDGSTNYGIGSSAQLDITGSEVGNIIIAGYDNDFVDGAFGNDLLFGGNLQFLFGTVEDGVTNLNLANITLDGEDELFGDEGNDGIVYEADGGVVHGDAGTDTLWLTDFALGTNAVTSITAGADGRSALRIDLGAQTDIDDQDSDVELGYAGYGGADRFGTADQTTYVSTAATKFIDIEGMEIVDASGLSTGVRGLDYFAAGTNDATDVSFSNRQDFQGYEGDLDLRGALNVDNNLYAGPGNDVIEGRGGSDTSTTEGLAYDLTLQGGDGNDDFYFSIDGDAGADETNIIRRKVDANNDGFWDGSDAKGTAGTWGQDFGQGDVDEGDSVLKIDINKIAGSAPLGDVELGDAVNFVSEIVTGVENADGTFTAITLNSAAIRAATTYEELAKAINDEIEAEYPAEAGKVVAEADGFKIVITDTESRTLADTVAQVPGAGVTVNQKANTTTENIFEFGQLPDEVTQDRIIFKSYEDRSDNEGVDDDAITGSEVSLGEDAYAEDLVVSFDADGTRLAEDQEYALNFKNLTTQDKVTISVNGVTYELTVGVAVNGSLIDNEDTRHFTQQAVQTNFLTRMAGFINSFMDDDTAAGQVGAATVVTATDFNGDGDTLDAGEATHISRILLTQVAYSDGEETVFMKAPTVTVTNGSGGEKPTATVDNDAATEVFLFNYDGRNNNLNVDNVLFWGQESVTRSTLETAATAGDTIEGSEALVIDGGFGAGDDDIADIVQNKATDRVDFVADSEFQEENFAVHGDDFLLGGAGDDTISGMTGDDRVQGSLGNDTLDGGKDWYAVKEDGDKVYHLEYLNAFEAEDRDADGDVLDIKLIWQTEDGHDLIEPADESPDEAYEAYFDDTLIYAQADFTAGVSRFTITLNDYSGTGEDIEFDNGGAGTVGVDANGDGTVEADNVSTFTNFENIRTVSGVGFAVAGATGGQGRDTLNVNALSDDSDVGVLYDLTGDGTAGNVYLIEDLDDDEDTDTTVRKVIAVDGVENVIFGDGDDVLLIDETEAAKDNVITGDLGEDVIVYENAFDDADDEPTVTIIVGNAHGTALDAGTDQVTMTEGRVGAVLATDTLIGIETIDLEDQTAAGIREDDELNVENLSAGASVNYITGEVFSDTDGDLDFDDGVLQLTIVNMEELEYVVADGRDAVVVGGAFDVMSDNDRTDDDTEDLTINTYLNYDLLDERGTAPERLTIADLRAIDGGTADTADENDIPEGYNFAQFNFELGENTDTVDYSETEDAINAVVDLVLANDTQYVMIDADGGSFDGVDSDEADRVDALVSVERVVASQGESVLDFTGSDSDIEITFQYTIADNAVLDADDGYSVTNTVRIADGEGDTIEGLTSFVERYTAEDGDITNATWSRIEGSDNDETVIYEGSEDLTDQFAVDHRFSDDTLNLRGGDNTVSYSPLETSITATIDVTEYDPLDPTADQIEVTIDFQDGDGGDLNTNFHTITSYAADNEIAAGTLKLEASQDAEDTLVFAGDTDKLVILGQSPGVITVDVGDVGALVLTGFEFVQDSEGDDTYDIGDLDLVYGDLVLLDSDVLGGAGETTDDRDTIAVYDNVVDFIDDTVDDEFSVGYPAVVAGTVSLEVLNDAFQFDFDVLDISGMEDEDDLIVVGDDDDHDNDATLNETDVDYEDDVNHEADYDHDGETDARDTEDDLIVGDLGLIDSIELFDGLWLTDLSVEDNTDFILDTTGVDYSLTDADDDEYFPILGGIDELNFSLVTEDISVLVLGNADMLLVGGSGDDDIEGGGGFDTIIGGPGADDLDGGQSSEVREIELTAAMLNDASGDDIDVDFNGGFTTTITEGVEIPEGAGITQIKTALLAAIIADLDDINLADPFGVPIASVEIVGNILRFTFEAGADVNDADFIDIDGNGNGDSLSGEIAGSEDIVSDGSDGGDDTFVYDDVSESTVAGWDQIANFSGSTGDVIDLSGANDDALPVVLEDLGDVGDFADFDPEDFFNDDDEFNILAVTDGTDGRLYIDADGDGDLDMVIELLGQTTTDEFDGAGVEVIG